MPVGAIEVLVDCDNQPWFKRADVGQFLELKRFIFFCKQLSSGDMKPQCKLSETIVCSTDTPAESNQSNIFLSVYGVMHVIVNSQKESS